MLSLIVAMDELGCIGRGMQLPWHIPNDLKQFRARTLGNVVIMGRRTFESIGKPLSKRTNVVLTRSEIVIPGCVTARDFSEAILLAEHLRASQHQEIFVIGGAEVYRQALELPWHRCYVTLVHAKYQGDVKFPVSLHDLGYVVRAEAGVEDGNNPPHTFITLSRKG